MKVKIKFVLQIAFPIVDHLVYRIYLDRRFHCHVVQTSLFRDQDHPEGRTKANMV